MARTSATSLRVGLACAAVAAGGAARAAEPAYMGTWTIESAVEAPWVEPGRAPDAAERSRLLGKAITFKAKAITGAQPFTCRGPHYKLTAYTAELLFQGAFQELHEKDARRDPAKLAAGLGFRGPRIQTLETGCEFDFHFVDRSTAEVGLNDYIYTLKRR
jgi:hypothetical protein